MGEAAAFRVSSDHIGGELGGEDIEDHEQKIPDLPEEKEKKVRK